MAIAKGRVSLDSYYENLHKEGSSPTQSLEEPSSLRPFGLMDQKKPKGATHGGNRAEGIANYSSSSGSGLRFGTTNSPFVDSHNSIFNFKSTINSSGGCNYTSTYLSSSMLSFEQAYQLEDYSAFADAFDPQNDPNFLIGTGNDQTEDEYWACSEKAVGSELLEGTLRKRPHMGGDLQPSKKLSTDSSHKKTRNVKVVPKDPQSIAAKNRRERISERLKILQDLVPNGTKVDMVTMLEKAINYVKFLQLQVKVLATDEFWPTQGGKAPELSQVKEAIDAILSSQNSPTLK